ncbi:nitroreductase [Duganella sp. FT80W]|uniref:Nitroreductase n=2 Tax=Duganella guangzhouensis TaxID=2666084 RepID=A0A6I2L3Y3_9BURK|nr:nitroreductase [Duganella guangzhouensis]
MEQARDWSGGTLPTSRAEIEQARHGGFKSFFESRHSIRQFSGGVVAPDDLRRAVETAQKTPSVCNRQSWQVHAFSQPEQMARLLQIQSGSRGFGEQASAVLVVTSDLRSFLGVAERYQAWIDGGMFAMSLCLALHDLGYGSCCLNWSKEPDADKALRAAAGIEPYQQIIMLLAVGTLPEQFSVARSYRPPVDQVLVLH